MACSLSRLVCSTYSLVFFGTSSGMSCSGGGPASTAETSRFALRCRIFTIRAPLAKETTNDPSSLPNCPKTIPRILSSVLIVWISCFPLYIRISPFFNATRMALYALDFEGVIAHMVLIGDGK